MTTMSPSSLVQLIDHAEWADALVWRAVREVPSAAEPHPRIRFLLHHVHLVQNLYLQIWRGDELTISEAASFPDLGSIQVWGRTFYPAARNYLRSCTPEALELSVTFPWADSLAEQFGTVHPATVSESVLQVSLHSTHHRGQLSTLLRELGGEPPTSDFITWIWLGKPGADWSGPAISVQEAS